MDTNVNIVQKTKPLCQGEGESRQARQAEQSGTRSNRKAGWHEKEQRQSTLPPSLSFSLPPLSFSLFLPPSLSLCPNSRRPNQQHTIPPPRASPTGPALHERTRIPHSSDSKKARVTLKLLRHCGPMGMDLAVQ